MQAKLPLRSVERALWLFVSALHLSLDQCSLVLGVGNRAIRTLFQAFDAYFVPAIERLSDSLSIGGLGFDVELDEICFRSVARAHGVVWVRFWQEFVVGSVLFRLRRLMLDACKAKMQTFVLQQMAIIEKGS